MFSNRRTDQTRNRRNNNSNVFGDSLGRRLGGKHKNMNIISAVLGTATLVVLCASLVEPKWFELEGGECCLSYLGISLFFGKFNMEDAQSIPLDESCKEGSSVDVSMCVNSKALMLIHVIIAFCFFAIISSLFSFILDVLSPRKNPLWKALKRYAIGYIFCVLNAATTVGFAYWASQEIYNLQFDHKQYPGSKADVMFGTGVYLVTAAGGLAILATASNLMRQYPTEEEEQAELLLDAMEEMEDEGNVAGSSLNLGYEPNPPPPYMP